MTLRLWGAVCVCALASGILTSANAALVTGSISLSGGFTPVSATVIPVPAAAWLFGSGLIGLIGFAKRKAA